MCTYSPTPRVGVTAIPLPHIPRINELQWEQVVTSSSSYSSRVIGKSSICRHVTHSIWKLSRTVFVQCCGMTALGQGLKITYLLAPPALLCTLTWCGTCASALSQREECLRVNHQCHILQHSAAALAVRRANYSVVTMTDFLDVFMHTSGMSIGKM